MAFELPEYVEDLRLTGTSSSKGFGNARRNRLFGNSGANLLDGGPGNDTLTGGAGQDRLRFSSALNASSNVDRLPDFNVAEDTIVLNYRAFPRFVFGMFDTLSPNRFHIGSTATQSTHYVLYNPVNGALLYDGDGNGPLAAVRFSTVRRTCCSHTPNSSWRYVTSCDASHRLQAPERPTRLACPTLARRAVRGELVIVLVEGSQGIERDHLHGSRLCSAGLVTQVTFAAHQSGSTYLSAQTAKRTFPTV